MSGTMSCWLLDGPGAADAFRRVDRPIAAPPAGWVVVAIEAFGLNRSELFSRRGLSSPDFSFPRVLGLECCGTVHDAGDSDLAAGQRVIALMGGMGRSFDGSYATHTVVPRSQVFPVRTDLPAETLGALPETYNTADLMVLRDMKLIGGETVLVHGGTSALGMAVISIARHLGCTVLATSRSRRKAGLLARACRADHVLVDDDELEANVADAVGRVDAVVNCVGDARSVALAARVMNGRGRLGLGGQLGESWNDEKAPDLPDAIAVSWTNSTGVRWPDDAERIAGIVRHVEDGDYAPNVDRVFAFDDLPEAQRAMENNEAVGKLVVRI